MMKSFSASKIKQRALLLFIFSIGFVFRFINLKGDAPAGDISRSGVFYVDEGTYAHNVVNKALFGEWFLKDDYNAISNVPIFSAFQYIIIKAFGAGLAQIRCGGVIYSLLALFLLWLILRSFDSGAAGIALTLGAANYFFIIYNRLALLENLLILFLVSITALLFLYHRTQNSAWLILATTCLVAGYFVKATVVFCLPVFFITIYLTKLSGKIRWIHCFIFLITFAILAISAIQFWILPHQADWLYFHQLNISAKLATSPLQILFNYARYLGNLKLFPFMPVMYTIFLFYVGFLISNLFNRKNSSFPEIFFMTWAVSGILFLGFFEYSPPRFSLILLPAIISLTALFFSRAKQNDFHIGERNFRLIIGMVVTLSCCQIAFGIYRIIRDNHHFLSCYLPGLSIPVVVLLYRANKKMLWKKYHNLFLISILSVNLIQIGHYHFTIQFSYYHAMKDMKNQMDQYGAEPKVLAGDIAPLVAAELKIKAVNIIFRPETERSRFVQQRPTFLILQDNKQLIRLKQKMPDYLADICLLKSYRIFNNYVNHDDSYFYRINWIKSH